MDYNFLVNLYNLIFTSFTLPPFIKYLLIGMSSLSLYSQVIASRLLIQSTYKQILVFKISNFKDIMSLIKLIIIILCKLFIICFKSIAFAINRSDIIFQSVYNNFTLPPG
jgi:hypothetical protein